MEFSDIYLYTFWTIAFLSLLTVRPNYFKPAQVIDVPQPLWCVLMLLMAVYYMGSVGVIWGNWTSDRANYVLEFINVSHANYKESVFLHNDLLFGSYIWLCSQFMNYQVWLYLTALIYIGNYFLCAKRLTGEYMYVLFLAMLCNFQFFSYGTHIIRGGLAGSFVLLALSFYKHWFYALVLLLIAFNLHASMIIPIVALVLAVNIRNTKLFLWGWALCLIVTYLLPGAFEGYLSRFMSDRTSGYLNGDAAIFYGKTGFRWDFLTYSFLPIYLGYYYINKLNLRSQLYEVVYRMYLAANAVWLMVIRVPFTDRFAYLSWFLFPILLFYPLLTKQLFLDVKLQRRAILITLFSVCAFVAFMHFK